MCPSSVDPFYVVRYYIKWVTTFWTHCIYTSFHRRTRFYGTRSFFNIWDPLAVMTRPPTGPGSKFYGILKGSRHYFRRLPGLQQWVLQGPWMHSCFMLFSIFFLFSLPLTLALSMIILLSLFFPFFLPFSINQIHSPSLSQH